MINGIIAAPGADPDGNAHDTQMHTLKYILQHMYDKISFTVTAEGLDHLEDFVDKHQQLRHGGEWTAFATCIASQAQHTVLKPNVVYNMRHIREEMDMFREAYKDVAPSDMFVPILARVEEFEREQNRRREKRLASLHVN
jgi:hypothetical protein